MSEPAPPPNDGEGTPPPPSRIPPPPLETQPALGIDRAWAALTPAGRVTVSVLAILLVVAAAVGIGLAASGDGDGDGTVVIAETAAEGVTLEVPQDTFPPSTDDFPEPPVDTTAVPPPDTTADTSTAAETTALPTDDTGGDTSAPTQSFSSDQGDIGAITVDAPSTLAWTSDGDSIVLLDLKSGATLVDSTDASGEVDIEPADYDILVTAGGSWTVEIRPR